MELGENLEPTFSNLEVEYSRWTPTAHVSSQQWSIQFSERAGSRSETFIKRQLVPYDKRCRRPNNKSRVMSLPWTTLVSMAYVNGDDVQGTMSCFKEFCVRCTSLARVLPSVCKLWFWDAAHSTYQNVKPRNLKYHLPILPTLHCSSNPAWAFCRGLKQIVKWNKFWCLQSLLLKQRLS